MEFTKREQLIYELGEINVKLKYSTNTLIFTAFLKKKEEIYDKLKLMETPLYEAVNDKERRS